MSKDPLDKVADAVKRGVDDVKDTVHESGHRAAAEGERERREVAGREMPATEKAGSMANEAKHRAQAELDAMKRDLRNKT